MNTTVNSAGMLARMGMDKTQDEVVIDFPSQAECAWLALQRVGGLKRPIRLTTEREIMDLDEAEAFELAMQLLRRTHATHVDIWRRWEELEGPKALQEGLGRRPENDVVVSYMARKLALRVVAAPGGLERGVDGPVEQGRVASVRPTTAGAPTSAGSGEQPANGRHVAGVLGGGVLPGVDGGGAGDEDGPIAVYDLKAIARPGT